MSQRATINGRSSARANVNKRRPGSGEGGARQETTREGRWRTTRQETTREGRGGETRQEKSRGGREGEKQGKRRPGGRGEGEVHVVHKEKKKQW